MVIISEEKELPSGGGKLKPTKSPSFGNLPRRIRVAELAHILARYDKLSSNREFAKDCQKFDRLDAQTVVGDRRTAEAAVEFYLKWEVYPIPEFLVNDHNFRVCLERFFMRRQRVMNIPVSPLTTKAEVLRDFRQIEKDIRRPKKAPNLERLRIALLQRYLIHVSAFHEFKPSDFAAVVGSKVTKGKSRRGLSAKELNQADRRLRVLRELGIPYPIAEPKARRQVIKKRWRESKLTPKIRMATERAIRTLRTLLEEPNI